MKRLILLLIAACALPLSLRAQTAISDLPNLTSLASGDLLPVVDVSDTSVAASGKTKHVTMSVLSGYIGSLAMTLTNKTITDPTITGGTATELIALSLRSTGAAFDLGISSDEVLTAPRTLKITMGNADRRITLAGDVTFTGAIAFTGAFSLAATLTGDTDVTFPTGGTLLSSTSAISMTTNTLTGTSAQFNTANTDDDFAFLGAANTFTGVNTISNTTASTNSTTGAVIVSGGIGVAKDSWINTVRIGLGAGADSTSTAVGTGALDANVVGTGNTAVGYHALNLNTGSNRVGIGVNAGASFSTGTGGVAVGANALTNATTGSSNVGLGSDAGRYQLDGTTALALTGDGNLFLGGGTRGSANAQTNSLTLGYGALSDGSNTQVIGNTTTTTATRIEGVVSIPDGIRASGIECQNIVATTTTPSSTATTIPLDSSIPQNTEGAQILTVTITPTSATSTLEITFNGWFSISAAGHVSVALFQDSTANALPATHTAYMPSAGVAACIPLRYTMTAGTTSATTFKIRYGPAGGTGYFLQLSTGALFTGAIQSELRVREIRP